MSDFQFSSNRAHTTTTNDRIYLLQIEVNIISEDSNLACKHDKGGREPIMIKDLGKKYVNTKENTYMILQTLLELYFLSKTVTLILDVCLIGGNKLHIQSTQFSVLSVLKYNQNAICTFSNIRNTPGL